MKHFCCLINPRAGSFSRRRVSHFVACLEREGATVTVLMPRDRDEALRCARRIVQEGTATHLVVGGGDGTIADIASVVVGSALILCLLPIGTANVLAYELGVPHDDREHARHLVSGTARVLWPGVGIGPRGTNLFMQMAGLGLDGAIVHNVSTSLKARIGRCAYLVSGVLTWLRYRARPCTVWLDETPHQCVSLIVSKGRFYGGRYAIALETQHGGKGFNVIVIKKLGLMALAKMVYQSVVHHTLATDGVADIVTAQRVTIEKPAAFAVQMDGDARSQCPSMLISSKEPLWIAY